MKVKRNSLRKPRKHKTTDTPTPTVVTTQDGTSLTVTASCKLSTRAPNDVFVSVEAGLSFTADTTPSTVADDIEVRGEFVRQKLLEQLEQNSEAVHKKINDSR